ncbi:hypothetical protein [Allorhodopirellula heiligendammensis]|uniref:Uncharacterized protein n=1 Tax=Allorhodopirellula heiligendammensis TaxID=2714739 RepID=A0A5C6C5V3_9BACT|nr:hypothetical protein [Allorhodopirellula heiligendammensis]TWU19538.1 hypothetical protein Poly21_17120 [Allorhodopirellula heiligendammensis]
MRDENKNTAAVIAAAVFKGELGRKPIRMITVDEAGRIVNTWTLHEATEAIEKTVEAVRNFDQRKRYQREGRRATQKPPR